MKHLIIYASNHGATKACAEELSSYLTQATAVSVDKVHNLSGYDSVILGTGIYASKPLKSMQNFCTQNQAELLTKKLGLFICCISQDPNIIAMQLAGAFPANLRQYATKMASFGGTLDPSKLSLTEKSILKIINKSDKKDTVDHQAIKDFAESIQ